MTIWDGKQLKEVPTAVGQKMVSEGKAIDLSKHDGAHLEGLERMFARPFYQNKMMQTKKPKAITPKVEVTPEVEVTPKVEVTPEVEDTPEVNKVIKAAPPKMKA